MYTLETYIPYKKRCNYILNIIVKTHQTHFQHSHNLQVRIYKISIEIMFQVGHFIMTTPILSIFRKHNIKLSM
jgi:hypothetical protein